MKFKLGQKIVYCEPSEGIISCGDIGTIIFVYPVGPSKIPHYDVDFDGQVVMVNEDSLEKTND